MGTTHALAGALVGLGALGLLPGASGPVVVLAGFLGGLAPDFDIYLAHRRTFHFPVYLPLSAGLAAGVVVIAPATATLALAVFLAAAALHSVTDLVGGGLELRPWEGTSDRAVYSHYHGHWLAPRRLVPYDGSPADLALAAVLGLGGLMALDGSPVGSGALLRPLLVAAVVISVGYAVARKHLPVVAVAVARLLPARVTPYVPDRYRP